ncbi:amino acid ABC transporter permease [Antarcticirhabdus aurantiaca]|uniref:Amino acid ABC transporter permease n=1 Tax=Antarcticirhabdus aurantiaca TaxID=2606717 RepID=A0ACD4NRS6_9HYPH|nr:amino acid ABC transporter permease [Antarcticirhabdus aurantiaca]WAJ29397.1 amino acid ABC transporter permease [Jeongeuplla avenae]
MNEAWIGPVVAHLGRGLLVTLWISLLSVVVATVVGIAVGSLATSPKPALRAVVRGYVTLFRGIPSLLILLCVFFALPQIGLATGPLTASVIGLGLWGSANIAEAARGALFSISPHQGEAARALGMSARATLRDVLLPQAARRFLPPYIGQLTVLIHASALTSVVGVSDILGSARQMIERLAYMGPDSHAILIYGMVLAVFFAICYPLTLLADYAERRLRV